MLGSAQDALFGRLAINRRFLGFDQLARATTEVERRGGGARLSAVLVELGLMTSEQVAEVDRQQQEIVARRVAQDEERNREPTVIGALPVPPPVAPPPALPVSLTSSVVLPPLPPLPPLQAVAPNDVAADPWDVPSSPSVPHQPIASIVIPIAFLDDEPPSSSPAPALASSPFEDALGVAGAPRAAPARKASMRLSPAALTEEARKWLVSVLAAAVRQGASDIHVHAGETLRMRRYGTLWSISDRPLPDDIAELGLRALLADDDRARFDADGQVDCALSLPGVGRFRVNVYRQHRGIDGVFRVVKTRPPTLSSLNLPASLARLTTFHQGIVLVTGPGSSGKSSTLAALVHMINEERAEHVVTIEDPIEVLHPSIRCVVNQRQAGRHTESFPRALRAALREDPDVIVIGEMRDRETAQLALTAAETGHLVLATLHTQSAVRTINRVIGEFPPAQQPNVRSMLAESLRAVVSQRLLPRKDGNGVVPAVEVLMSTPAVANLIRESRTHQIRSAMQTGSALGMQTLEAALSDLVARGVVDLDVARRAADEPRQVAAPPGSTPAPSPVTGL